MDEGTKGPEHRKQKAASQKLLQASAGLPGQYIFDRARHFLTGTGDPDDLCL
jgi:hypothetical protein